MRENKDYTGLGLLLMFISLCLLALIVWTVRTDALAGVSVFDYCNGFPSCGGIQTPLQITNEEIVWTEEMEKQRLEALKKEETVKPTPKEEKQQGEPKEVKIDTSFDINRLAKAVAMAETENCTKGYGITHNNCHGIKSGNTYKCPGTPRGRMCKFKNKEESFTAFRVIWSKWYKTMPDLRLAKIWTGDDNKVTWLYNVNYHYNKLQ